MKHLLTGAFLSASLLVGAQENLPQLHQENNERNPSLMELQGVENLNVYKAYKKAKVWNFKSTGAITNVAELGPNTLGGRVRSVLADKTNNIFLLAPSGGGLWTFDPTNGKPFSVLDDLGSFMAVTAISQNPFNAQTIYISTGDALHGVAGNGIFKSTDGGKTFSMLSSTDPSSNADFKYCSIVKCSPQDQNTLYVAAGGKLFKSTNSGTSWTNVFSSSGTIHALDFTSNGGVIIAVDQYGIYYSSNGNSGSFNLSTSGIWNSSSGTWGYGLAVATQGGNSNTAVALVTTQNTADVYKSTNGGASWTKVTSPPFGSNQPWFSLCVGIHPSDANKIVVGSIGWAFSKDGGSSWSSGCDLEVDFHTVHFHSSNPDVAYLGYDQGFGSVDFANEKSMGCWQNGQYVTVTQPEQKELGKTGGFNTLQIYYGDYYPTGDNIIVGHQDGGCMSKKDGAEARIRIGDGGSVFVSKQNSDIIYASTQSGNLSKTTTGNTPAYNGFSQMGASYYQNHPNWITQFAGNNADGNQLYIASNTSIDRTTNAGVNFSSITAHSLKGVKVAVSNASNPMLYAVGYNQSSGNNTDLIKITNAKTASSGTTVSNLLTYSTDGIAKEITVDPNDQYSAYVTTSFGNAYKLSNLNGTHTKTSIKGDMGDVPVNMVIGIDGEPNYLFAATHVGLFYSTNGGTNWKLSSKIPHTQIKDLKYRSSDKRLFIFTYGRGAFAATFDKTVSVNKTEEIVADVFPNPSNNIVTISHSKLKNATLRLYNIYGELVLEEMATSNQQQINLSHLAKGNYIFHISKENKVVGTNKIVLK